MIWRDHQEGDDLASRVRRPIVAGGRVTLRQQQQNGESGSESGEIYPRRGVVVGTTGAHRDYYAHGEGAVPAGGRQVSLLGKLAESLGWG